MTIFMALLFVVVVFQAVQAQVNLSKMSHHSTGTLSLSAPEFYLISSSLPTYRPAVALFALLFVGDFHAVSRERRLLLGVQVS